MHFWCLAFSQLFQSTLPRRERRFTPASASAAMMYFNPRSREGSDVGRAAADRQPLISIHAPAKGATCQGGRRPRRDGISIHAPAKGATSMMRV